MCLKNKHIQYIALKNKNTPQYMVYFMNGGQGWIRTIEDEVDGFTVRCIWPLWNLPINLKHPYRCFLELVKGIEPSTC